MHLQHASGNISPKVGVCAGGQQAGRQSRSLLQSDQTCVVALEYSILNVTGSNFSSSLAVNDLSQASSSDVSNTYSNEDMAGNRAGLKYIAG